MAHNEATCPKCQGDWPWCESCKSYHSPCNPTCRAKKVDLAPDNKELLEFFGRYDKMVLDGKSPDAVLSRLLSDLRTLVVCANEPQQKMDVMAAFFAKTYKLATRAFPSVDPKWADVKPVEEMPDAGRDDDQG